jgi:hypothetical protein
MMSAIGARASGHWRRYRVMYAVLAVCAAPVIASYFAYYVMPPSGRTNYGELLAPRQMPYVALQTSDGRPFSLASLAGRWVMVTAGGGACNPHCEGALLQMRQQRLITGKDRDRLERVWLITDDAPVAERLQRDYDGTLLVRASAEAARSLLPSDSDELAGQIWLVDPMGNVMLRWPRDPRPERVKQDIERMLTASSHWVRVERKD